MCRSIVRLREGTTLAPREAAEEAAEEPAEESPREAAEAEGDETVEAGAESESETRGERVSIGESGPRRVEVPFHAGHPDELFERVARPVITAERRQVCTVFLTDVSDSTWNGCPGSPNWSSTITAPLKS